MIHVALLNDDDNVYTFKIEHESVWKYIFIRLDSRMGLCVCTLEMQTICEKVNLMKFLTQKSCLN